MCCEFRSLYLVKAELFLFLGGSASQCDLSLQPRSPRQSPIGSEFEMVTHKAAADMSLLSGAWQLAGVKLKASETLQTCCFSATSTTLQHIHKPL